MLERVSHYLLLEKLGTGGMGTVYRATDEWTGQTVAVKTLHPHLVSNAEFVRRFEHEAEMARHIDSRAVVDVLDTGRDGDSCFLVMEYVEGKTLAQVIEEEGQIQLRWVVSFTTAIARALAVANVRGIVHRDISPQNVIITPDGRAKVTDFGIARDTAQPTVTATSMLLGKPSYVAPEVVTGSSRADIRADIYSLGIVVFQMLAGELPFKADTPYSVMQKQVTEAPPNLSQLRAETPAWLISIVERCLTKDPGARFQRPEDVLEAIENAGSDATLVTDKRPVRSDAVAAGAPRLDSNSHSGSPARGAVEPRNPGHRAVERRLAQRPTNGNGSRSRTLVLRSLLLIATVVTVAAIFFVLEQTRGLNQQVTQDVPVPLCSDTSPQCLARLTTLDAAQYRPASFGDLARSAAGQLRNAKVTVTGQIETIQELSSDRYFTANGWRSHAWLVLRSINVADTGSISVLYGGDVSRLVQGTLIRVYGLVTGYDDLADGVGGTDPLPSVVGDYILSPPAAQFP